MRKLSETFMKNLAMGFLKPILDKVKKDHTLDIEIRRNYINIYYRGGNLLKISEINQEKYQTEFNTNYDGSKSLKHNPPKLFIPSDNSVNEWLSEIPFYKQCMDEHFASSIKMEREIQQLMVRENNYSPISNATDYFIVDIEYNEALEDNNARFDMIGIKWESKGQIRKKNAADMAFFEVKYGDKAISDKAGLQKHVEDMDKFLAKGWTEIRNESIEAFKQKRELGLIIFGKDNNLNAIETISEDKPEYILVLVNHDPESTKLKKELSLIATNPMKNANLKIVVAGYMGYGLFVDNVKNYFDILNKL